MSNSNNDSIFQDTQLRVGSIRMVFDIQFNRAWSRLTVLASCIALLLEFMEWLLDLCAGSSGA